MLSNYICGMIKTDNNKPCPACGDPIHQGRSYCKPCRAAYLTARRRLGLHKRDSNAVVTERRRDAKAQAVAALGGACNRCGWAPASPVEFVALHFHHPQRDRSWASFGFGFRSAEAIAKELARCELLCVRCHVLEHAGEPGNKPGRPRKAVDKRLQYWLDRLGPKAGV